LVVLKKRFKKKRVVKKNKKQKRKKGGGGGGGGGGGNRVAHSRPALRGGPYSKSWRRRESVTESCLIGSVVELFDVILALLETKLSGIQHPDFNRNIKRRESELQCAGCMERGKAATTTSTSTARR